MYKVLIVEDDPMVAMINEQYIKRNKHFSVVGICRDGAAALRFLEQEPVDLVIMDVYMPQMDGFETLREMRSRKLAADAIMVTAANDLAALEEALHLGVVDYLIKPFTFGRFQTALDKYISQRGALHALDLLNQTSIDHIIDTAHRKSEELLPKGIQEKTLQLILEHMEGHAGIWFTGDQIAAQVGLTGVTVRRYMSYLAQSGRVTGEMNYETGGRPCMRYRID